jgi:hypothetical protein
VAALVGVAAACSNGECRVGYSLHAAWSFFSVCFLFFWFLI